MQKKPVLTLFASLTVALPLLVAGAAPASAADAQASVADASATPIEINPPVVTPFFSKWWCEAFNC
ncbi:hypothetical protein [Citricoccus nitrophenolicus]|uniref:hypothetical protein n=1 Tax=Citricoccus nitrophenolicus TaxID=863575 RepID=UPI0031E7716E